MDGGGWVITEDAEGEIQADPHRAIKESRRKHSGQGAVLEDLLEEVAWRGARVVDLLIVS